jgi:tetratricopeptide (TPR) repeat protein
MKVVPLLLLVVLVLGCAPSERFLWEEYMSAGVQAGRAGRYDEAERHFKRAATKAEELGPQEMGRTLNNMGELYRRQGRLAEAERLFERSLAVKEVLGRDHPDVATGLNNLARVYIAQGRVVAAVPLLERSLVIQEKALTGEHPAMVRTMTTLAQIYRSIGRDNDAFILEVRAKLLRDAADAER